MLPGTSNPPSANAALPPHPYLIVLPPISYPFLHHPHHRLMFLAFFLYLLFPFPLTPSGFFNKILGLSESRALSGYTLFHLILLILFCIQVSNFNSSCFFRIPDYLFCDLIAPTASASSFSSDKAYLFLNYLLPLFLRLTSTLIV